MAMVPQDALAACDAATLSGVFLKSSRLDSEVGADTFSFVLILLGVVLVRWCGERIERSEDHVRDCSAQAVPAMLPPCMGVP